MNASIEIKERPAQRTVAVRTRAHVKDLPNLLPGTYGRLVQYLNSIGVAVAEPAYAYAAYHNMDMEDLDVEAGFPVASEVEGSGDIIASEIPAGRFATVLHTGPYEQMEPVYDRLDKWVKQNKHEPTGVIYEMYLNGPDDTPPEGLQTQILMPLK
jgi:effector-binding domain-containing protein